MNKSLLFVFMLPIAFSINSMEMPLCKQAEVDCFFDELFSENPSFEDLEKYIEKGTHLSIKKYIDDEHGLCSPLKVACLQGKSEVCAFLIEHEVDVTEEDDKKFTLLHVAAQYGHHEVCTLLINAGLDVNAQCNGGATPLHYAVLSGDIQICREFIENGALVGVELWRGNELTPLSIAAMSGYLAICELLYTPYYSSDDFLVKWWDPHNEKHKQIFRALLKAIEYNEGETFSFLLGKSNIHRYHYDVLLYSAVCKGQIDLCELLIKKGAWVTTEFRIDGNRTALHAAAEFNYLDVCTLLILHGADIYAKSTAGTPLDVAKAHNSHEVCNLLEVAIACKKSSITKAVSKVAGFLF